MDHHQSHSAEQVHPSVRVPGLVPPIQILSLPAQAERTTSTTPVDKLNPRPGQPCSQTWNHRAPK